MSIEYWRFSIKPGILQIKSFFTHWIHPTTKSAWSSSIVSNTANCWGFAHVCIQQLESGTKEMPGGKKMCVKKWGCRCLTIKPNLKIEFFSNVLISKSSSPKMLCRHQRSHCPDNTDCECHTQEHLWVTPLSLVDYKQLEMKIIQSHTSNALLSFELIISDVFEGVSTPCGTTKHLFQVIIKTSWIFTVLHSFPWVQAAMSA